MIERDNIPTTKVATSEDCRTFHGVGCVLGCGAPVAGMVWIQGEHERPVTAADKLRELLATRPAQPGTEELVRWWKASIDLVPELLADRDAWAKAGQDVVDMFDPMAHLHRALPHTVVLVAGAVQAANSSLRADLATERARSASEREELLVKLQVLERHRPDAAEMARLDKEVVRLRAELEQVRSIPRSEVFDEGFWRSCTGCHERNEGHATGPYGDVFRCHLGSGCRECGGLGAVWEPGHPASWLDCENCRSLSKSGAEPPRCDDFIEMENAAKEAAGG